MKLIITYQVEEVMKFLLGILLFWLSSCGTELIDTPVDSNTSSKKDTQETPISEINNNDNKPSTDKTDSKDDTTNPPAPVTPVTPVTSKAYCEVKKILTDNCIACHSSRQPRLGSENIRETLSNDRLVHDIYREIDSGGMPRGKDRLDQKSIDLIKSWMNDGSDTSATCP